MFYLHLTLYGCQMRTFSNKGNIKYEPKKNRTKFVYILHFSLSLNINKMYSKLPPLSPSLVLS